MNKKIVIGNLKMYVRTARERSAYIAKMRTLARKEKEWHADVVVCPPFVHLEYFAKNLPRQIQCGAQDVWWTEDGSYTGEISPAMLDTLDCHYAIIGHSERRTHGGETDELVNRKIKTALAAGIHGVLCVGESAEERSGSGIEKIAQQVRVALSGVPRAHLARLIIAYEPVWAVGTDVTPSSNDIMGARLLIRKVLTDLYGKNTAQNVRILYGGSVHENTVDRVCREPGMDGVLVGRDSAVPEKLFALAGRCGAHLLQSE